MQADLEVELRACGGRAQRRQLVRGQAVDARHGGAALARQHAARAGQALIAHDAAAQGLALDAVHDETFAEPVGRLQHMAHAGHGHAACACGLDELRFRRQARGAQGARAAGIGRAAQHQRMGFARAGGRHIESPGLLAGAAREPAHGLHHMAAGHEPPGQPLQCVRDQRRVIVHGRSVPGACATARPRRRASRT
ncbi:hypothetical protein [Variovorax sp. V512]|uniref:hypothetical protein n=1 Tax=Variovorax sp. V512 TaxID=3064160 RepID=UPI0034E85E65